MRSAEIAFSELAQFILRVASLPLTWKPPPPPPRRMGWPYLCSMNVAEGAGGTILHVNKLGMGWRFGFMPLFLQPCSLCWVIKFTPYVSQPHLFPRLSSLCSSAFSDLLRPCDDRDPRSGGRVWSAWACVLISKLRWNRRFHTSPYLIPELPLRLRFISSWLISMGCIFQVELAARRTAAGYRSSGTLPECSSESLRRLKVPLATKSCTCFPHNPGIVWWPCVFHASLWYFIGNCVLWCVYCIIFVLYTILKSSFYWHLVECIF